MFTKVLIVAVFLTVCSELCSGTSNDQASCTRPNEKFDCRTHQDKCGRRSAPAKDKECIQGCYCVKGYARNQKNVCVPYSKCPKPAQSRVYEERAGAAPPPATPEDTHIIIHG